ncbi:glycosyltransferase [Paraburkholderia terricola]|jgi:hypothetical protein|uniref:glycosyltransferase n=1 Tax=Paraburkholderia terricola TaxID=169427 RepID=UPI001FC9C593|nr:glycosyltransferase [Paraburkholderia terricola]
MFKLSREWEATGRPSAYVNLTDVESIANLVDALGRVLQDRIAPRVVASSSESALESGVEAIVGHADDALILLDDFQRTGESMSSIAQLALRLGQAGVQVVVATIPDAMEEVRRRFPGARYGRIDAVPWSRAELAEYLKRIEPEASEEVIDRTAHISAGNPRLALLTLSQIVAGTDEGTIEQEAVAPRQAREVLEALLARHADRIGVPLDALARPLIRLVLSEGAGLRKSELTSDSLRIAELAPVVDDGDYIRLLDPTLGPELIRAIGVMPPATSCLGDLDFGAEEAERDPLLADHFVPPAGLDDLLNGRRNIVVGDRGAGKSALFATLADSEDVENGKVLILKLEDPAEFVLRLESDGKSLSTADQFRAAWLLSVASTLAVHLRTESPTQSKLAAELREALPGIANKGERVGPLKRLLKWLTHGSLKIQLGPVVFDPPKSAGKVHGGRPIDLTEFLRETCAALKAEGCRVIVAVDRIDEVHKYQRQIQEPLVQGLFLAESSPAHGSEITLMIFIRSDLFETYDIQEKNKLVTRRLNLQWQTEALIKMMLDRIFANPILQRLRNVAFDGDKPLVGDALRLLFPAQVDGRPFEEWLWHSTRNGNGRVSPRQLILLLVLMRDLPEAANYHLDTVPLFSESILRSAMTRLSELSFDEATDDFRVAPTFLRNLRAGRIDDFALSEVQNLFSPDEGSVAQQVEMLERLGIVERVIVRDAQNVAQSRMRLPALYTRCWRP